MRLSEAAQRVGGRGIAGVLAATALSACAVLSRPPAPDPEPFREAAATFWLEATTRLDTAGQAAVEVRMTVPTSLASRRPPGSGTAARVRWTVEVLARPDGTELHETSWVEAVVGDSLARPPILQRSYPVPPGDILVNVTAEDEETGTRSSERAEATVPEPGGAPAVVGLQTDVFEGGEWRPVVDPAVHVTHDSLRVRAQVANSTGPAARVVVERLEADVSVALPPFASGRPSDELTTRGVRLDGPIEDTTAVVTTSVDSLAGAVRAVLGPLEAGAYRVRVEQGDVFQDRALVVRRGGFPEMPRVGDLVAALAYITTDAEMRALTARLDPYLQRRAFDRFWGDRIADRRLAASTVRAYAARVEAANRLFSTQKEGWKTDKGLAYVLFGPPARLERGSGRERWIYGPGPVSGLTLDFLLSEDRPADWPFEVWVLARGPAYDVAWERARRAWRRGEVP